MKSFIYTFLLLFLLPYTAMACSCGGPDNFCQSLASDPAPLLVIKCIKTSDYHHGMKVNVLDVLVGEESRTELTVWGDNGALCRHYTGVFNTVDTLILALHPSDLMGNWIQGTDTNKYEKDEDYHLSVCGIHVLSIQNNNVVGSISPTENSMNYETFKNQVIGCSPLSVPDKRVSPLEVTVSPNPTSSSLTLQFDSRIRRKLRLRLLDITGRLIIEQEMAIESGTTHKALSLPTLPQGAYFFQWVTEDDQSGTTKVILTQE